MADDEGRAAASTASAQVLGAAPVVDDSTMEDIVDKLKLLGYESGFCGQSENANFKLLSRTFFTVASDNANHQFFYFTSLCSWLMGLAGNSAFAAPGQFDDPNAVSTNLLGQIKAMDVPLRDVAPNRIRQGHGDAVLSILTVLTDRALMTKNFAFSAIVYPKSDATEERVGDEGISGGADGDAAVGGVGGGEDDVIDDRVAIDSDSDDEELFAAHGGGKSKKGDGTGMIEAQVSTEVWNLEVERVGPLLQYRADDVRDWRSRVDNATTLLKAVDKMYPDVKAMLDRMGGELSKTLDRIQKREQTLGSQFQEHVEDYRNKLRELNMAQDSFNVASKNVSQLSVELNSVSETLDHVKAQIQDREDKSSDITPLMKIKEAVAKVKSEIKVMSLRIGILQHTVLHYALRQQKAKRNGKAVAEDDEQPGEADFSEYM
jgi:estrogen-related receptor beta like 1